MLQDSVAVCCSKIMVHVAIKHRDLYNVVHIIFLLSDYTHAILSVIDDVTVGYFKFRSAEARSVIERFLFSLKCHEFKVRTRQHVHLICQEYSVPRVHSYKH